MDGFIDFDAMSEAPPVLELLYVELTWKKTCLGKTRHKKPKRRTEANSGILETVLTVDVPADVPGGEFERVVDALQNSLQLLFLRDLRLGHLRHVQLLALQLLWRHGHKYL